MSALDVVEVQAEEGVPFAQAAEPAGVYRKRKLGFWFWASVAWLALLLLSAIFADLLPLKDPDETFRGVRRSTGSGPTTSATTCSAARSTGHAARSPSPRRPQHSGSRWARSSG